MLDLLQGRGFEIRLESHAAAILEKDFPEALSDIERVLLRVEIPIQEIIGSGGGETKGTQRIRRALAASPVSSTVRTTTGWSRSLDLH